MQYLRTRLRGEGLTPWDSQGPRLSAAKANRDWIYIYGHFGCSDQSTTGVIAISVRIDNPVNTIAMSTKLKSVSFSRES